MQGIKKNESGSVALIFSACAILLVATLGMAVDAGRALMIRQMAQVALDAAILSGVSAAQEGDTLAAFNSALEATQFSGGVTQFSRTPSAGGFNGSAKLTYAVPTTFLGLLGVQSIPITVTSRAFAPITPASVTLTLQADYGYSGYTAEFWVERPDGTQQMLASMAYVSTDRTGDNHRGTGTTTITPSATVALGSFTKFWVVYNVAYYKGGNSSYASNDPNSADHYFINGQQQQLGEVVPINTLMACGTTTNYALEDSPNPVGTPEWDLQDSFFSLQPDCSAPAAGSARLTN